MDARRRTLDESILFVALAGMILAAHLWIQKQRGFDQGCLGIGAPTPVVTSGCRAAAESSAGRIFGVSNAAWGYAFYFGLALLTFGKLVVSPRWAVRLHRCSEIATAAALLYSAYLVYVMAVVVRDICPLCILSAGFVATLAVLHGRVRSTGGFRPGEDATRPVDLGRAAAAAFGALGLLFAVVLFVDRVGIRPLGQGSDEHDLEASIGRALPLFIDAQHLAEMRPCRFDPWAPAIDTARLVGDRFPGIGRPGGVTVVAFFDPDCPHCAELYPQFMHVAEEYQARARFIVVPCALWRWSVTASAALRVAQASGKYFDLWSVLLRNQSDHDWPVGSVEQTFTALGIPTGNLAARLAAARKQTVADQDRFRAAGIHALPAIYIDGSPVAIESCSGDCIKHLVEQELSARQGHPHHQRRDQ